MKAKIIRNTLFILRLPNGKTKSLNYDSISDFNDFDIAIIEKNKLFGLINNLGEEILSPYFNYISDFSNGIAAVAKDNRCGYIDVSGNLICNLEFDRTYPFRGGYGKTEKNGYYGFLTVENKKLVEIIPPCIPIDN